MRPFKLLLCAAALLATLAFAPKSHAQISVTIGAPAVYVGGPPPVCPYGYFDYPPYECAPVGFYGPGYFYNGIFLGVGPWHYWGYRHGWGEHRFYGGRGGFYAPGRFSHDHPYRGGGYDRGHAYAGGHGYARGAYAAHGGPAYRGHAEARPAGHVGGGGHPVAHDDHGHR
jgi:hypothetical protein